MVYHDYYQAYITSEGSFLNDSFLLDDLFRLKLYLEKGEGYTGCFLLLYLVRKLGLLILVMKA